MKAVKDEIRSETLRFHQDQDIKYSAEKERFAQYVKSIPHETWVIHEKSKLASLIDHEASNINIEGHVPRKHGVPQLSVAQTAARLGFGVNASEPKIKEPIVGLLTAGSF